MTPRQPNACGAPQTHEMHQALGVPLYFVLGNHDFYRSSFEDAHERMSEFSQPSRVWLTHAGAQLLTADTALIGDDGWADGRLGDYFNSNVMLNDYLLIREFIGLSPPARFRLLNQLGDEAAARITIKLQQACAQRKRVILLTHVPPFLEACWHEGRHSDPNWLPHFASKSFGDAIVSVMDEHPDCHVTVLCGHTHSSGVVQMRPNVLVKTGAAVYRQPAVQEVFDV